MEGLLFWKIRKRFNGYWGGIFWLLAFAVFSSNIKRQFTNQAYVNAGSDKRQSGIPYFFSFFVWIGVAFSPLTLNLFWALCLILEIPALVNFIDEPNDIDPSDTANTTRKNDIEDNKGDKK